MRTNAIERAAWRSDPGYLTRVWEAANGTWSQPSENDLRAFLMRLAKDVEK